MIYAVIDTNVFVSALLSRFPDSATVQVLSALSKKGICPLYNQEILDEYHDVLNRDKFRIPSNLVDAIINKVKTIGIDSKRVKCEELFPDPKDAVFYEVALSRDDAYVVTGNLKHFPKKPIVVTPAEMVSILEKQK